MHLPFDDSQIDENLLDNYDLTEGSDEFAPVVSHEQAAKDDRLKNALSPLYQIPDGLAAFKEHQLRSDKKFAVDMLKKLKDVQNTCEYSSEHYEKFISDARALSLALSQISSAMATLSALSGGVVETSLEPPPIRSMPGVSKDPSPYDPSLMLEAINLLQTRLDGLRACYSQLRSKTEALSTLVSEADLITLHCSIEGAKVNDDARAFSSGVISRISDLSHKIADVNAGIDDCLGSMDSELLSVNSSVSAVQAAENEAARYAGESEKRLSESARAISARDSVINEYLKYAEKALDAVETSDRSIRAIGERSTKIHEIIEDCHDSCCDLEAELTGSRADYFRLKNDLRIIAQTVKAAGEGSRLSSLDKFIKDTSRLINKVIRDIR